MNADRHIECRYCGAGNMFEETFDEAVKIGRSNLVVRGQLKWVCENCQSEVIDSRQFELNEIALRKAEDKKAGYLTVAMLREFREKYGLSQRLASKLIGAGKSAFGKYESGGHISKPAAKLIRVALAVPAAAEYLANEEDIDLAELAPKEKFSHQDELFNWDNVLRFTAKVNSSSKFDENAFKKMSAANDRNWQQLSPNKELVEAA